jgi:hypothetical protein
MDDVAHGLGVAAKLRSDLIGALLSIGAGKQYLTAAQGEGIRGAQSCLQTLALGVTQGTREDRFSHTMEDKLLPIILLGYALGPHRPGCCSVPGCTFLRTQPVLTPHSGTHLTTRSPPPRHPFGARSRSRPCGGSPSRWAGRDPRRLQVCSEPPRRRQPRRRPRTPHRAGPACFGHSSGAFGQKWSDMCKTLRLEGASRAAPPPSRRISDELSRTP